MRQKINFVFFIMISCILLSNCGLWKSLSRRTILAPPKIFVSPVRCKNEELATLITKSYIENLSTKFQVYSTDTFELYLASYTLSVSHLFDADLNSSTPLETGGALASGKDYFKLGQKLMASSEKRKDFQQNSLIDYYVIAEAKEKILGKLEIDNLKTAELVEIKVLDIASGELIIDEMFKQGLFEVVAPDRIGKKLASSTNARISGIQKDIKRRKKRTDKLEEKKVLPAYRY